MVTRGDGGKRIKSTQTAFDIVESIANGDRPNTSQIAAETGYSRSTIHYHLQTLQENHYVIRDDEGFRLGLRVARLGQSAREHYELSDVVEKPVDDLAAETGAIAQVAVREGQKVTTLYCSRAREIDQVDVAVGTAVDAHCTAYGLAILASLSAEDLEEFVEAHGLAAHTEKTITDERRLHERLETTRELGFAFSTEEHVPGISSIAAPVVDDAGAVLGAVGVTDYRENVGEPHRHIKARRFSDELPGTVQRTAQIIGSKVAEQR